MRAARPTQTNFYNDPHIARSFLRTKRCKYVAGTKPTKFQLKSNDDLWNNVLLKLPELGGILKIENVNLKKKPIPKKQIWRKFEYSLNESESTEDYLVIPQPQHSVEVKWGDIENDLQLRRGLKNPKDPNKKHIQNIQQQLLEHDQVVNNPRSTKSNILWAQAKLLTTILSNNTEFWKNGGKATLLINESGWSLEDEEKNDFNLSQIPQNYGMTAIIRKQFFQEDHENNNFHKGITGAQNFIGSPMMITCMHKEHGNMKFLTCAHKGSATKLWMFVKEKTKGIFAKFCKEKLKKKLDCCADVYHFEKEAFWDIISLLESKDLDVSFTTQREGDAIVGDRHVFHQVIHLGYTEATSIDYSSTKKIDWKELEDGIKLQQKYEENHLNGKCIQCPMSEQFGGDKFCSDLIKYGKLPIIESLVKGNKEIINTNNNNNPINDNNKPDNEEEKNNCNDKDDNKNNKNKPDNEEEKNNCNDKDDNNNNNNKPDNEEEKNNCDDKDDNNNNNNNQSDIVIRGGEENTNQNRNDTIRNRKRKRANINNQESIVSQPPKKKHKQNPRDNVTVSSTKAQQYTIELPPGINLDMVPREDLIAFLENSAAKKNKKKGKKKRKNKEKNKKNKKKGKKDKNKTKKRSISSLSKHSNRRRKKKKKKSSSSSSNAKNKNQLITDNKTQPKRRRRRQNHQISTSSQSTTSSQSLTSSSSNAKKNTQRNQTRRRRNNPSSASPQISNSLKNKGNNNNNNTNCKRNNNNNKNRNQKKRNRFSKLASVSSSKKIYHVEFVPQGLKLKEGGEIFIRLRKNENGKHLYQCPFNQECGAIQGQNVYYHAQRHRDERHFHCGICAKIMNGNDVAKRNKIKIWRFNTLKDLIQHQKAKHRPPVQCRLCGKCYSRGDSLKRHLRTLHHRNDNNVDDETKEDSNHCVDGDAINDNDDNDTGRERMDIDGTDDHHNGNYTQDDSCDADDEEEEEEDSCNADGDVDQVSVGEENDDDDEDEDFVLPNPLICRRKKLTSTTEEKAAVESRTKKQSTSTTTFRYSKVRSRRKKTNKYTNNNNDNKKVRRSSRLEAKKYKENSKISYKSAGYMDLISNKIVNTGDVIKFRRNTSEQYQYGKIMFRKKKKGLIYETRLLSNDKTEKMIEINLDKCDWFECDGETTATIEQQLKDDVH